VSVVLGDGAGRLAVADPPRGSTSPDSFHDHRRHNALSSTPEMRPNDAAEVGERLELGSRVRTGDLSSSSSWTSEQAILQGFLLFFFTTNGADGDRTRDLADRCGALCRLSNSPRPPIGALRASDARLSSERECGYITAPTDPNQPELDPKVWRAVSGQPCGFPSTMPPRHSQGRRRKSPPRGARVLAERRPGLLGSACVVGDGKRIPACRSLPPPGSSSGRLRPWSSPHKTLLLLRRELFSRRRVRESVPRRRRARRGCGRREEGLRPGVDPLPHPVRILFLESVKGKDRPLVRGDKTTFGVKLQCLVEISRVIIRHNSNGHGQGLTREILDRLCKLPKQDDPPPTDLRWHLHLGLNTYPRRPLERVSGCLTASERSVTARCSTGRSGSGGCS
jgi:hypothetical protein